MQTSIRQGGGKPVGQSITWHADRGVVVVHDEGDELPGAVVDSSQAVLCHSAAACCEDHPDRMEIHRGGVCKGQGGAAATVCAGGPRLQVGNNVIACAVFVDVEAS
jgi:hypothetical protein